jgi:DHA1 family bicyclomycin/chloramphenicol resistance-like MFS transporter
MLENNKMSFAEFVSLMALYVALTAMSIDMMLPALSLIGSDLHVVDINHTQYIISALFAGFTFGQVLYGPISDSFGRKRTVYSGLVIFLIGNILSITATNFEIMLLGRVFQGFGVAAPRIVSLAIVRDLYKGREMARVMSVIMTIFILAPVLAPGLGQLILLFVSWQVIFLVFIAAGLIATIWTYFRLPETLKKEDCHAFEIRNIWNAFCKVANNKITLGYTVCSGIIFGALIGYLNSSRQIFQDYFQVGKLFPLFFGISALAIGGASLVNSSIVRRFGMKIICHYALIVMIILSVVFLPITIIHPYDVPLGQFMIFAVIMFFCVGLLFGNLNALAMEPMGHYAGTASAFVGSVSSAISVIIGTCIGQSYNNTLMPIISGFLILAIMAFVVQKFIK